jgi:energy-coupling factor transporter ATP-binding protein EcfA2
LGEGAIAINSDLSQDWRRVMSEAHASSTQSATCLEDFNPLAGITLPGGKDITTSGLILFVGPNSSGKTQLLKDVHATLLGQPRKLVVAQNVAISKPRSFDLLLDSLVRQGYMRREFNDKGVELLRVRTVPLGGSSPELPPDVEFRDVKSWFANFKDGQKNEHSQSFFSLFGAMLSSAMFLANRLTATGQTGSYDYEKSPPTNDLQALYGDSQAIDELTRDIRDTFSRGIWVDSTRGGVLCFRLTDHPNLPSAEDRLRPDRVTKYRVIDEEGDGLRSFVAICMVLALSRRPVCLIDEPEICLHPPQAYSVGRIIGRQATKQGCTTLVATHSSHVLRGVIQQTRELQIVRLTRVAGVFRAHLVDSDVLRSAIEKPLVRTETIFDGLFADGVVLVESDGDRAVYQAVWESLGQEVQLDLLFVPVNGKGAMADIATFFKTLQIPVAVIPDLDLIRDDGVIPRLLSALSVTDATVSAIRNECRIAAEDIRTVPPTINPSDVDAEIQHIMDLPKVWQNNDDDTVMKSLRGLAKKIDRMRRMKKGGIAAYAADYPDIAEQLEKVKQSFWECGVFIVPVGELESWLSDEFMGEVKSRERKQEWADEAANRIRQSPNDSGPIRDFVKRVGEFLQNREILS